MWCLTGTYLSFLDTALPTEHGYSCITVVYTFSLADTVKWTNQT